MTPSQMALPGKRAGSARVGGLPTGADTGRVGGHALSHGAITGIVGHVDAVAIGSRDDAPWAWALGGVGGFMFTRPARPPCTEALSSGCWD